MGDILQLTLVRATDLMNVKAWGEIFKQDPYAVVTYNEYDFRTKVHEDGGKNPVFNETFAFPVDSSPTIQITIFHDGKKHDDVIGRCKLSFSTAHATGYAHEKIPLYTTEGRQQGFLEVVLKFPSVIDRFQSNLAASEATKQIEKMKLLDAKAEYAAKLGEALKTRKQKAAVTATAQQTAVDESVLSLNTASTTALSEHASKLKAAKTALLGADAVAADRLKAAFTVNEPDFYHKVCKGVEEEEEFRPEIDALTGTVFAAARKRPGAVEEAKAEFRAAVEDAVSKYLDKLQSIQSRFDDVAGEAAKEYMKEARTKIFWKEEAQAEADVAGSKPPA